MSNSKSNKESREFANLLKDKEYEITLWTPEKSVGFSILKKYPKDCGFKPAYTKNNKVDSFAMVQVGYHKKDIEENKVPLVVRVSKVSKYLLNDNWDYDFNDDNSPTKESLNKSKESIKPIDLEERGRYIYNLDKNTFFDKLKDKKVTLDKIVNKIFQEHVETTTHKGLFFRIRLNTLNKSLKLTSLLIDFLVAVNKYIFGKDLKPEDEFMAGWAKPYLHKDLVSLKDQKPEIFNYYLPISKRPAILLSFYLFFSFYLGILGIYIIPKNLFYLLTNFGGNSFFIVSVAVITYFLIDYFLPHLILTITNLLIRISKKLRLTNIKFASLVERIYAFLKKIVNF